jgi:4-hydroxythreonine-4-phosphate dehydrogenase
MPELNPKPLIAVTMGDPCGIGPEILVKALADRALYDRCRPVVIGNRAVLFQTSRQLGWSPDLIGNPPLTALDPDPDTICVLDSGPEFLDAVPGLPSRDGGIAAGRWIRHAAELAMSGQIGGMTTCPINKETLGMAGYPFPGHTEFLASLSGSSRFAMMLAGGPLKIAFVTTHQSIADIPPLVRRESVLNTLVLLHDGLRNLFGILNPRIGLASLNPHGGENGLFGKEEIREIVPAAEMARKQGMEVFGPVSPDALFFKAYQGEFDGVVVMYHDQGLIPLKMIAFKKSVNLTLGLPFIRTSVDHGTAYDIAGKGIADPSSLKEAILLAADLAERKNRGGPS